MNGNREIDVHYVESEFPYPVNESYMNFFDGLSHAPVHYSHPGAVHDQENAQWSMHTQSYKFGISDLESTCYGPYSGNHFLPRSYDTAWGHPLMMTIEEPLTVDLQSGGDDDVADQDSAHEESNIDDMNAESSQASSHPEVSWQDNIDPDDMTYEELLDLGEAVGTENRGLSKKLISSLPISKYRLGSIFTKKKSVERCVICQMSYKRGQKQTTLPCKHHYHSHCITKWLTINKACPICNVEVFGEESGR